MALIDELELAVARALAAGLTGEQVKNLAKGTTADT